jgi:MFS transporter, putative metabolite:H+ symporter
MATLWSRPYRAITAVLWVAWFAISLGYYGVFSWLPTALVDRGYSFLRTYQYAFLLVLAQVPGYLSAAWLVERWGRATLAAYLTASALFTWLFAVADTTAGLVTAGALMSFFAPGGLGALYAYTRRSTRPRCEPLGWGRPPA